MFHLDVIQQAHDLILMKHIVFLFPKACLLKKNKLALKILILMFLCLNQFYKRIKSFPNAQS